MQNVISDQLKERRKRNKMTTEKKSSEWLRSGRLGRALNAFMYEHTQYLARNKINNWSNYVCVCVSAHICVCMCVLVYVCVRLVCKKYIYIQIYIFIAAYKSLSHKPRKKTFVCCCDRKEMPQYGITINSAARLPFQKACQWRVCITILRYGSMCKSCKWLF